MSGLEVGEGCVDKRQPVPHTIAPCHGFCLPACLPACVLVPDAPAPAFKPSTLAPSVALSYPATRAQASWRSPPVLPYIPPLTVPACLRSSIWRPRPRLKPLLPAPPFPITRHRGRHSLDGPVQRGRVLAAAAHRAAACGPGDGAGGAGQHGARGAGVPGVQPRAVHGQHGAVAVER